MQVDEDITKLAGVIKRFCQRQRGALLGVVAHAQALGQGGALDIVHHQIDGCALGKIVQHAGNIGMAQPGQQARLAAEAANGLVALLRGGLWRRA
jgi:hypothetical protein